MCAANKVAFVNAVNRTNLFALTATGANRIINNRKIVDNLNCTIRTSLLALHAANATVGTIFASLCSLCVVRTLNHYAGGIIDKMDNGVGAGTYANAASNTLAGINVRNVV